MTQNDEFYLEEQRFPKSKQKIQYIQGVLQPRDLRVQWLFFHFNLQSFSLEEDLLQSTLTTLIEARLPRHTHNRCFSLILGGNLERCFCP